MPVVVEEELKYHMEVLHWVVWVEEVLLVLDHILLLVFLEQQILVVVVVLAPGPALAERLAATVVPVS